MIAAFAPVFAHQYGWDEIAMFLVPIVLAVAGVRYAEKRAAMKKRESAGSSDSDGGGPEIEQHQS